MTKKALILVILASLLLALSLCASCGNESSNNNGGDENTPPPGDSDDQDDQSGDSDETPDTAPPVISNIVATRITATSYRITWTTDEPATTLIEYGETEAYGTPAPPDTTLTTSHIMTLNALSSNTTYHFRVHSSDAANNASESSDQTFSTS